jgi:membrane protein implicated in regulation of membrane protease activity
MESIRKLLSDPGWWLSVVVVAILIAPIQKLVTDAFYSIAAKSSEKWAKRKERKAAERYKIIMLLACDETMLILEAIITFAMFSAAFYVTTYLFVTFGDVATKTLPKFLTVFNMVAKTGAQVVSVVLLFFASKRFMRLVDAYLYYRNSREKHIAEIRVAMLKKIAEEKVESKANDKTSL